MKWEKIWKTCFIIGYVATNTTILDQCLTITLLVCDAVVGLGLPSASRNLVVYAFAIMFFFSYIN